MKSPAILFAASIENCMLVPEHNVIWIANVADIIQMSALPPPLSQAGHQQQLNRELTRSGNLSNMIGQCRQTASAARSVTEVSAW